MRISSLSGYTILSSFDYAMVCPAFFAFVLCCQQFSLATVFCSLRFLCCKYFLLNLCMNHFFNFLAVHWGCCNWACCNSASTAFALCTCELLYESFLQFPSSCGRTLLEAVLCCCCCNSVGNSKLFDAVVKINDECRLVGSSTSHDVDLRYQCRHGAMSVAFLSHCV